MEISSWRGRRNGEKRTAIVSQPCAGTVPADCDARRLLLHREVFVRIVWPLMAMRNW
jgi:hypothetical protein